MATVSSSSHHTTYTSVEAVKWGNGGGLYKLASMAGSCVTKSAEEQQQNQEIISLI